MENKAKVSDTEPDWMREVESVVLKLISVFANKKQEGKDGIGDTELATNTEETNALDVGVMEQERLMTVPQIINKFEECNESCSLETDLTQEYSNVSQLVSQFENEKKVRFTEECLARDWAKSLRLDNQTKCNDDVKVKEHSKPEGNSVTEVIEAMPGETETEVVVTEQGKWRSVSALISKFEGNEERSVSLTDLKEE